VIRAAGRERTGAGNGPSAGPGLEEIAVNDLDRRTFLMRGSLAAAAAGIAAAVPLGAEVLSAPAVSAEDNQPVDMPDPVIAHVIDAGTGEIAVYVGHREVTIRDPRIARQLVRAVS
jgi:hypothetical protein